MTDLAFYLPSFSIGGAEKVVINLANEFNKQGYNIDIIVGEKSGGLIDEVDHSISIIGTNSPPLPAFNAFIDIPYLVKYFSNTEPQAFYSAMNHINIPVLVAWNLSQTSTRLIISEHNDPMLLWDNSWQNRNIYRLAKKLYPTASHIVAVSNGVKDNLAKILHLPTEAITKIYNPIVTDNLMKRAKEPVEHKWFSSNNCNIILGVGRFKPQKNFPFLIEAFSRCDYSTNDLKLVIIGNGPERQLIEDKISALGLEEDTELIGNVDNIYKYYYNSDVFALSSIWEGFGNVIVEALACGCPVVSTNCPSGPAEILGDGEYGKLVPVGDVEKMTNALIYSINSSQNESELIERAADFHVNYISNKYKNLIF